MSAELLHEVVCPNCRHPIDLRTQSSHVTCEACGSQFLREGHFCPHCHAYHEAEQSFCPQCGMPMVRICYRCHSRNGVENEYCQQCGAAMDVLDLLALQQKEARHKAETLRQEQVKQLREQEEAASAKRMAELQAVEAERIALLRQRQQQQKQNDLRLFIVSTVLFLCLIIVIIWIVSIPVG